MATYAGSDKRLQYLFEHIGDGGTANLYGTTAPDSSITADDGTLYIQYDDTSYEVVALFAMIEQSWQEINVGGGGGGGSARYKEVELWSGTQTVTGDIALSDSVKNYDAVIVRWTPNSTDSVYHINIPIMKDQLEISNAGRLFDSRMWYSTAYMGYFSFHFSANDTLTIDEVYSSANASVTVLKVIGIKWETMQTALIYSTEEREVGVWTDGKPLYQKTLVYTPSALSERVDLSTLDIDTAPNIFGTFVRATGSTYGNYDYPLLGRSEGASYNTYGISVRYEEKQKELVVVIGGYTLAELGDVRITLQYTKTTDTAGSGTWTTTGEYAHHYSTSEKVVGTWIDGSTLYEITVTTGASAPTGATLLERRAMTGYDVLLYTKSS